MSCQKENHLHHALRLFCAMILIKLMAHILLYIVKHTHSFAVIDCAAFALPQPKICLNKTCQNQCQNSCYWQKERITNEINFDKLYLNNHAINVKSKFIECRSRFFWEKLQTYYSVNFWMDIIQEKAYFLKPHLQTKARLTWIPSYKQIFILRLKLLEIICLPGMLFQFIEETLSCMVVLVYFMLEYCKS